MFQILILTFLINIALAGMVAFALQPTLPSSGFSTPKVLTHQALSEPRDKDETERACVTTAVIRLTLPNHLTAETPRVPKMVIAPPEPLSCLATNSHSTRIFDSRPAEMGI